VSSNYRNLKLLKDVLVAENMAVCFMPTAYGEIPPTSLTNFMYKAEIFSSFYAKFNDVNETTFPERRGWVLQSG
jgi:hypothetical protein